jgi:hypothetical protein
MDLCNIIEQFLSLLQQLWSQVRQFEGFFLFDCCSRAQQSNAGQISHPLIRIPSLRALREGVASETAAFQALVCIYNHAGTQSISFERYEGLVTLFLRLPAKETTRHVTLALLS